MDDVQPNNLTTEQGAERIKALYTPQDNQAQEAEHAQVPEVEDEAVEPPENELEQVEEIADDEGDTTDETLYKVVVDGQEMDVSLDELVKGYQLEAHYTKKSQKLAEETKAIQAERAVLSGVNQKFEQLNDVVLYLQQANEFIEAKIPPEPEITLADTNPGEYIKRKEARQLAIQQAQYLQGAMAQTKEKAKELVAELQKAGHQVIAQKMPELLQRETTEKLYGYLQNSYGYTADQINMNVDPNLFIIAEKARRYDEMANKSVDPAHVAQKVTKAKPKPKPYQNKTALQHKAAKSEFQKKPSFENAAALIKASGLV